VVAVLLPAGRYARWNALPMTRAKRAQRAREPLRGVSAPQPRRIRVARRSYFFSISDGLDTVSRFQKAVDQMFTRVASDRPRVLIIDIRENGGGEDSAAQALLRHLTEKRFRLPTSVQIKRSKEAIVSTPRARSATGRASLAARACWSRQSIGTPGAWRTTRI
jgi:hypothetical protein